MNEAPYPRQWPARASADRSETEIGLPALTPQALLRTVDVETPPQYVRIAWRSGRARGPVLKTVVLAGSLTPWVSVAPATMDGRADDSELVLEPATAGEFRRSRRLAALRRLRRPR